MSASTEEEFISCVVRQIRFPFDRKIIAIELNDHLNELESSFINASFDPMTAKMRAIQEMGDPEIIGYELNKVHKPIWGWLWIISKIVCISLAFILIWTCLHAIWNKWQVSKFVDLREVPVQIIFEGLGLDVSSNQIIKDLPIYQEVSLDQDMLVFTRILLDSQGTLVILYQDIKPFHLLTPQSDPYPLREFSTLILPDGQMRSFQQTSLPVYKKNRVLISHNIPLDAGYFHLNFSGYTNRFSEEFTMGN